MKIVSDPPHWLSTTFQAEDQLYPSPVRNSIPMRHYFIPSSLVLTLLRHSFIKCPYEAETLSVVFQAEAPQIPVNSQWSTRRRHNQTEALFNQKMACFKISWWFCLFYFLKRVQRIMNKWNSSENSTFWNLDGFIFGIARTTPYSLWPGDPGWRLAGWWRPAAGLVF